MRFHGAGVELGGVDAAGGDFGLGVAFGAGGGDGPGVELALEVGEGGIVGFGSLGFGWVEAQPAVGEAGGQDGAKG